MKMEKSTVYELARKNKLPAQRVWRKWRFEAEGLDDWVKCGDATTSIGHSEKTRQTNDE